MSRRAAEECVRAGRVTVDGATAHLGQKIDPATADVQVDGIPLPVKPNLEYHLLYKPIGVISTAADTHNRPTVVDLIGARTRLYPVGRLDAESEGLILVTNDGELANLLTHPSYGVPKTYVVLVRGPVGDKAVRSLERGVMLEDGPAAATKARVLDRTTQATQIELVMVEGRNREIRRMLEAVGHEVERLVRTAIGPLRDSALAPGQHRTLSIDEIRNLYAAAL